MKKGKIAQKAKKKLIKRRFRLGENEKEIIKMIGLGGLVLASLALPNLPVAFRPLIDRRGQGGMGELLNKLIDKKVINLGGEEITLTSKGKKLLKEIQFHQITIPKPKKWDGIWWLVSYDIPEVQNRDRDNFRMTLKRWEFIEVQASLWVYPFECREEVAIAASFFNVEPYVIVMSTDILPKEESIRLYFNL